MRRALLVVAALVIAGCSGGGEDRSATTTTEATTTTTSTPTTSTTVPSPPTVAALGDSQLFESLDELRTDLGSLPLIDHAVIGLATVEGRYGLANLMEQDPAALIVVLGTNDALDGQFTDAERQALDELAGLVSEAPCVRWLDVATSSPVPAVNAAAEAYNNALVEESIENGFLVVQWSFSLAAHPEWFRADGVHLTDEGQKSLAAALTASLETCLSLSGGALPARPGTTTTLPVSPVPAPG